MLSKFIATALMAVGLCACNKIPESEEAKKIGNIPKQTIDKAQADLDKAMQKSAERNREADKKE